MFGASEAWDVFSVFIAAVTQCRTKCVWAINGHFKPFEIFNHCARLCFSWRRNKYGLMLSCILSFWAYFADWIFFFLNNPVSWKMMRFNYQLKALQSTLLRAPLGSTWEFTAEGQWVGLYAKQISIAVCKWRQNVSGAVSIGMICLSSQPSTTHFLNRGNIFFSYCSTSNSQLLR